MLDLLVTIINYKTPAMTLRAVQSVLADVQHDQDLDATIAVIDNASGDGSADEIAQWIADHAVADRVVLVRSATNSGFSGGHNQGIAHALARYYLLMNSDALIERGALRALIDTAEATPRAGLISPRIVDERGAAETSYFRVHSPQSELIRGACSGPVTRMLQAYDVPIPPDTPVPAEQIDWVSFACVLLRHDMVAGLGPMDEGYFLYFEDAEYCLRAKRAGWGMALAPQAQVMHIGGASGTVVSTSARKDRLPAYFYASRTRFFYQAYGLWGLWAANLMFLAGRGLAKLRWLAGKPPAPAHAYEARDIWRNALHPRGPRCAPWETGW